MNSVHYSGFFTFVLTEFVERSEITQIFIDCWKHRMINVNVLIFNAAGDEVVVNTYFPYRPSHCEHIESSFLMSLSNESIDLRHEYFPNKLHNFYGCPLILATYAVPPYMILHRTINGSLETRGIEGNLYHELASTLNFRPLFRIGRERHMGGAKENFNLLRTNQVNFTMFAIVNTIERSTEFTASFPYAYASVVFTTPHGPPFTPLEKLKLPFKPKVWFFVLCICCAALIVTMYVSGCSKKMQEFVFGAKNATPFLNFVNISLGGAISRAPVRNFGRTIFLIWLLGSLVLRSSYQGALFSFLQSQKSAMELTSLEELAQFNFTIYSSSQILRLLEIGSPQLRKRFDALLNNLMTANRIQLSKKHNCYFMPIFFSLKLHDGSFDILEALKSREFHGSYVTTRDVIGYHNQLFFQTGTLRPSKERILLLPLSIFVNKHSCLESIINHQIERFTSNGMIERWCNFYQENLMIARKQTRQQPKKLKFIEISGALKLCIILYGVCTMLFITEVISVKVRYLRKLFDHV